MTALTLLIVQEDRAELDRLESAFLAGTTNCRIVTTTDTVVACNLCRKYHPEVIILDLGKSFSSAAGNVIISDLLRINATTQIIALADNDPQAYGLETTKIGAALFLGKPINIEALIVIVRNFAKIAKYKRFSSISSDVTSLPGIIGTSTVMQSIYRLISASARTDANVLIIGETGTGKELVARAIHELSPRKTKPFSVYFGSVPSSMSESELFGYLAGAFTGANSKGTDGSVKRANEGTLFIDELCSLDLDTQRKLLRTIEEKTYKPLGSDVYVKSDFRLVCAAQPIMYDLVRTHRFREDLLSRIEVITISLPSLRERVEDIVPLAIYFLKSISSELIKKDIPCSANCFSKSCIDALCCYDWPRNVRQLKSVIHYGLIQAQLRGSEQIDIIDIHSRLRKCHDATGVAPREPRNVPTVFVSLKDAVKNLEQQLILGSLHRNSHSLSAVCRELGLGRTTLWRKIRQYKLMLPNAELSG